MNYRLFAALTACALLLTGCAGGSRGQTEETEPVASSFLALPLPDIFIGIPENYEKTSSDAYEEYYVCDDASIIITEDKEATGISAKDFSINAINQYESMTRSFELIGSETLASGVLTVEMLEFTYTLVDGMPPLTSMVGYATDGNSMYIMTCKCSSDTYASHRAEFLSVLQSIRIDRLWNYPTTENLEETT